MTISDDNWSPDFGNLDSAPSSGAARKHPVRVLAMGDFSGRSAHPDGAGGGDLAGRKPLALDFDNFEATLQRFAQRLTIQLGEAGTPLEFAFSSLDDFHPDQIYASQEIFKRLRELRRQLENPASFEKAAAQLASGPAAAAPKRRRKKAKGIALPVNAKLNDFAQLVNRTGRAEPGGGSLAQLIREVTAPFAVPAVDKQRQAALRTALDQGLAETMRAILHHPDFLMLESLWRGMDFLVRRLETGAELELWLLDLSAEEFAADLGAGAQLEQTALHRLLVEQPALTKNGGFNLLLGLYEFELTPTHAELLGRMAKIAAKGGSVFATALAPDHAVKPDSKLPPLVVSTWKTLRALPEAGALALVTPRFLLRQPYGKKSDPIDSFQFEEFTRQEGLGGMLWGHPTLLLAAALASPDAKVPESLGELAYYYYQAEDGEIVPLPCTERAFTSALGNQLVGRGINALLGIRGQPSVRLAGLQSLSGAALPPLLGNAASKPGRTQIGSAVNLKASALPPRPAAAPAESPESDSAAEASPDSSGDALETSGGSDLGGGDSVDTATSDAGSSELDAALSAMDTPAEEPAAGGDTDGDLEALLKSLS